MADKNVGIGDLKDGDSARLTFKANRDGLKLLAALSQCSGVMAHAADEAEIERVIKEGWGLTNSWVFSFMGQATDECKQLVASGLEKIEKV
jgi:hypothetical protein